MPMADAKLSTDVYKNANGAWHQYLKDLSPLRPALYRYCRALTGNTWDADDLVQEALMRGFATLGVGQDEIRDPRAYLLRIAANAWIDWQRRKAVEASAVTQMAREAVSQRADVGHADALSIRDAGSVLIQELAPQERASLVLKDVFDLSLEETARILGSSIGAIKAALHRGRSRLEAAPSTHKKPRPVPSRSLLDRFVQLYNARDMGGLVALMLDTGAIQMMGVELESGREYFERKDHGWFAHNFQFMPPATRWERREFEGEDIVLVIAPIAGQDALLSVMRFEGTDDYISRIRSYAFSPETVAEIADILGFRHGFELYTFLDLPGR
jgi:RNA polymerase sigma-70 factor, ECF subfamily